MSHFAIAIALGLAATTAFAEALESTAVPSISAVELHARGESGEAPVVIDVRTADEYASGHVPGDYKAQTAGVRMELAKRLTTNAR